MKMKIKKYVLGMALGILAAACAYGNAGNVQAATVGSVNKAAVSTDRFAVNYSALKQTESTTEAGTTESATKQTESTTSATEESSEESTVVSDDKAKYKVKITITVDEVGWKNESADVNVKVEKIYGDKKFKIEKVEAKVGANGAYEDITDDMKLTITENCSVYVKVTDVLGNEYEKSRSFKCFDMVAPTLNAAVSEGLLTVLTYDTESGVKEVYINEYKFTPDENGIIKVRLQKFDATYQNFYIYAVDNAGNISAVNTVLNPYYTDPNTETDEEDTTDPADSLPESAESETAAPSTGTVTSVTDEDGNDISTEVNKKQFYTIVTNDGQQYYLVIDMSAAYTDDDGVNVTPEDGTVYFLTSVSNDNLLNFVSDGEQTLPQNSVATDNNIDEETVTPEMDETTTEETTEEATEEKEDKKSGNNMMIYIVVFAVVAFVIIAVKMKSGKKGKPEASDDELYDEESTQQGAPIEELTNTNEQSGDGDDESDE